MLAPTGFTRIADPEGELAVAGPRHARGLPYTLSTLGTRSIEEVAAVSDGRKWFQVYVWRDRGLVKDMIERAAAAGYEALVLTVDTAVLGRRERDVRRGFTLPPKIGLDTLSTARSIPAGRGRSCARSRSGSPTSSGEDVGDGATRRVARRLQSTRSSTRASRGATSSGCARCGTARS